MRSKIGVIVVIAVFLFCVNSYAGDTVGYINVQRIVSESNLGKKAKAEWDKITQKRNKEIEEKNAEIEALRNKFREESQKKEVNQTRLRELTEEIQQKNKDFERFVADAREELAKRDRELVAEILQKTDPILKKIAEKKGYSIILREPNVLAYLDPKVDVTEEVIKELDKLK